MSVKYSILISVCVFVKIVTTTVVNDLIVELAEPKGRIRGHILQSAQGKEFYAFQEIPYGKPPVGEKRFAPPELHDGWNGTLDCTENRKICYQFAFPMTPINKDWEQSLKNVEANGELEESEDCLYLNVYTPAKPGTNNSLSVYIFVHGGAFAIGDGTLRSLGPKYLIDGDIIVVTMNYRLGPLGECMVTTGYSFENKLKTTITDRETWKGGPPDGSKTDRGFLSTEDHVVPGNMGLKDQHLALVWTRKNIHLFGGNPQDIVLGGESAGAYAAGYHLLSRKTRGLVSGVIQQSGSHIGVAAFSLNPSKHAFELGKALMTSWFPENTSSLVSILKTASPEQIVKASDSVQHPESWGFINSIIWEPVIENCDDCQALISSPMHEDMMQGNFNHIPCFIGFNSEESLGFLSTDASALEWAAAQYDDNPSLLINSAINVENRTLAGEELKKTYTNSSFRENLGAFIRFTSDVNFIRAAIRQAELVSKYVPVYLYQLSAARNIRDEYPGVTHLLDMRYLWDIPPLAADTSPVDEDVREIVLKLWWNFIKYKNPTPRKDAVLQNIEWPTVEPECIKYLNLNKSLSVEMNPRNYDNVKNSLLEFMIPPYFVF